MSCQFSYYSNNFSNQTFNYANNFTNQKINNKNYINNNKEISENISPNKNISPNISTLKTYDPYIVQPVNAEEIQLGRLFKKSNYNEILRRLGTTDKSGTYSLNLHMRILKKNKSYTKIIEMFSKMLLENKADAMSYECYLKALIQVKMKGIAKLAFENLELKNPRLITSKSRKLYDTHFRGVAPLPNTLIYFPTPLHHVNQTTSQNLPLGNIKASPSTLMIIQDSAPFQIPLANANPSPAEIPSVNKIELRYSPDPLEKSRAERVKFLVHNNDWQGAPKMLQIMAQDHNKFLKQFADEFIKELCEWKDHYHFNKAVWLCQTLQKMEIEIERGSIDLLNETEKKLQPNDL